MGIKLKAASIQASRWLVNKEGEILIGEAGTSISGRLDKDVLVIYEYADLERLTEKRFGLMDMEENLILPCIFTNIFMQDDLVIASINEKGRMDGLILLKEDKVGCITAIR